jgi:hypothetical protein
VLRRARRRPGHPRFIVTVARRGYASSRRSQRSHDRGHGRFRGWRGGPSPPGASSGRRRRPPVPPGPVAGSGLDWRSPRRRRAPGGTRGHHDAAATSPARMLRFSQTAPPGRRWNQAACVSCGTSLAFVARQRSEPRSCGSGPWPGRDATSAGTDGAIRPFWSPDDQSGIFRRPVEAHRPGDRFDSKPRHRGPRDGSEAPGHARRHLFNGLRSGLFSIPQLAEMRSR